MLKKILTSQSRTIGSAALVVGAASLVSRLLGILRDRVLAGEFGAGVELDMYYAAFRIPDLVFNLLVLGALSAGFIPAFTAALKNKNAAWELANSVLHALVLGLVLISAVLLLTAPWLVKIITPGFTDQQLAVTTTLTRIMFLSPLLLGISAVFGSILQSLKQFFIYSIAPIFYNAGIIIGALYLAPAMGIIGLAWGVVVGALLHAVIQYSAALAAGFRHQLILDVTNKRFKTIIAMMIPRTLGLITSQVNLLIITIIGSTLSVGSIAIFNFANNLQSFPLGIFGVSLAIASFPTLAELSNHKREFIAPLSATVRQVLYLVIPSSVLLIILRAQLVRAILGTGNFDWEDTVLTLETLSLFAFSLFAQALIVVFIRAFYALEDSRTPFAAGLVAMFANVIMAMILSEKMGVAGLALAFSMSSILNLTILILLLHYRIGKLDGQRIIGSVAKIVVATFMLSLVAQAIKYITEPIFGTATFMGVAVQATAATFLGVTVYLLVSWLLKTEELFAIVSVFRRRSRIASPAAEPLKE